MNNHGRRHLLASQRLAMLLRPEVVKEMADPETVKRKHDILAQLQRQYMDIYREIALRAFSLLVEQSNLIEVQQSVEAMRAIRDERNAAQKDVDARMPEAAGDLEAEEQMLDRAISAMERMNENASKILDGFREISPRGGP